MMRSLETFTDIHTHDPEAGSDSVVSVRPGDPMRPDRFYSVGIHPWDTEELVGESTIEQLLRDASAANVVAIGEAGLDALRGGPMERQEALFRLHVALSEELGKPLIIHAVRTFDRLIRLRRELGPSQRWIIHGFRGKPQLAADLLRHGFDLSFGHRYNPDSFTLTPPDRRWRETDAEI